MNRGVDHQAVFRSDADRVDFGRALGDTNERFGMRVLAYCLMDTHFHLVTYTPNGKLSNAMHLLGTTFVRHANDRAGRDGPMFRSRYTSLPVTTDSYLATLGRYVHRNPLAIDGIDHPADYRWSSYRTYIGARRPATFLDLAPLQGLFQDDRNDLTQFTEARPTHRPSWATDRSLDLELIVQRELAVERLLNISSAVPRPNGVMVALLDHPDPSVRRLADTIVEFTSEEARRKAIARSRHRLRDDPAWQRIMANIHAAILDGGLVEPVRAA